jgi:undecaprenyl-diphosphatase
VTDTIKILCLAVVQGLTEFLPVSSSGHLVLAQHFLGVESPGPDLELFLHVGTLLSVCAFYRRRLASLLADLARGRRAGVLYAAWVLVSMIPAGVAYACGKSLFDRVYDSPRAVAALLVANGALLLLSGLAERRAAARPRPLDGPRALAMGVGQAIAVLPGISRSGTSIGAGRLLGLGPKDAAEFSFVMSIPVIAGAALLEFVETGRIRAALDGAAIPGFPVAIGPALAAAALAGAVGYLALRAVVRVLDRGAFWTFGPYCLAVGALALALA